MRDVLHCSLYFLVFCFIPPNNYQFSSSIKLFRNFLFCGRILPHGNQTKNLVSLCATGSQQSSTSQFSCDWTLLEWRSLLRREDESTAVEVVLEKGGEGRSSTAPCSEFLWLAFLLSWLRSKGEVIFLAEKNQGLLCTQSCSDGARYNTSYMISLSSMLIGPCTVYAEEISLISTVLRCVNSLLYLFREVL
jgi:hypothetical protein